MASAAALKRLEKIIWVLIYGGLFTLVLGVAVRRGGEGDGSTALGLMAVGALVALAGFILIAVRARLKADTP